METTQDSEIALFGRDIFGDPWNPAEAPLRERFVIPPFSVLNARDGMWQARKQAWIEMGIKSEVGRKETMARMKHLSKYMGGGGKDKNGVVKPWITNSIFDPVLCELAYKWWCPPGGMILDPFAGGSVRGIVAGALGFQYWGCDLRQEQIDANYKQKNDFVKSAILRPETSRIEWACGDSRETMKDAPLADFVFSCPPYGDLEVYSKDPKDISSLTFEEFVKAYKEIIDKACQRLKNDRFACFVVADYRDMSTGHYRNFPACTTAMFKYAGLHLYNEITLVTVVGTANLRATKQFNAGRKVVKTHQNVLVYVKGDWKTATKAIVGNLPADQIEDDSDL